MTLPKTDNPVALSPLAFTDYYVASLKQASPNLVIEVVHELQLRVKEEGSENHFQTFLENAYAAYLNDQGARDEIIEQFVASQIETFEMHKRPGINAERIVPIIKDRNWIESVKNSMGQPGSKFPEPLCTSYNTELEIFFAEDSEHNIRYLNEENLKGLPYNKEELLDLACNNLRKLLDGKIEINGSEGIYMISAGGNYENSLLLFSHLWRGNFFEVEGRCVISIPTRDLLLVTGSQDPEGIELVRRIAEQARQDTPYTVTGVLFVWGDGRFEVFEG